MNLNTASFQDFVANATILWNKGQKMVPQTLLNSGIFMNDPLALNSGEDKEYSEIDRQSFARIKSENGKTENILAQQGYNKRMTYYEYDGKASISRKMRDENKYQDIVNNLIGLGDIVSTRRELDLAHRFTFGAATSYTSMEGRTIDVSAGDSLAVFYSAHTLRGTSNTYRNRVSGDPQVSEGALELAEKLFVEETLNQFGEKKYSKPSTILTTDDPNTVNTVKKILRSTAGTSDTNSGVTNVNQNKYEHIISHFIATDANGNTDTTKRKYWFLISKDDTPFRYSNAVSPELRMWENEDTQEWFYANYGKYGICAVSGRGAVGSFPTAS